MALTNTTAASACRANRCRLRRRFWRSERDGSRTVVSNPPPTARISWVVTAMVLSVAFGNCAADLISSNATVSSAPV